MIGVTSVLCFLVLAGTALGGQMRDNRDSLRGLTALHVQVLARDPNAEKDGLSVVQLQRNIERQLKNAGIKVLADDEPHADARSAVLFCYRKHAQAGPLCVRNSNRARAASDTVEQGLGVSRCGYLEDRPDRHGSAIQQTPGTSSARCDEPDK